MTTQPKILPPSSRQSWLSRFFFGEKPNCFKVTCYHQSSYVSSPDSVFYRIKERTRIGDGMPLFAFDNFEDAMNYAFSWGSLVSHFEIYSAIGRDPVDVPNNILARPSHYQIVYYWKYYQQFQKEAKEFPFALTAAMKGTVLYMSIELKKKVWG